MSLTSLFLLLRVDRLLDGIGAQERGREQPSTLMWSILHLHQRLHRIDIDTMSASPQHRHLPGHRPLASLGRRWRSLCCCAALSSLVPACGARSTLSGGEGGSGVAEQKGATTSSASGPTTSSGGMCNLPPPPTPTQPTGPGCYTNTMNMGWVEVPCECSLWLENTIPAQVTASLRLTVSPPDQLPTLDGPLDIEIALADPAATYFGIWLHQPGNGTAFAVSNDGQATTVRMGSADLTLSPIPIPACTTAIVEAHIGGGSFLPKLQMHAVLDDGMPFATTANGCSNPPPT